MWGASSVADTGELPHYEKSINALTYGRISYKNLLPTTEQTFRKKK